MTCTDLVAKRKQYLFPTKNLYYREPIHLVKALGSRVFDQGGKEYLDAIGGIVSISVGHNHPRINQKIGDMVKNNAIQHTTTLYLNGYLEELGYKLSKLSPIEDAQCYITNSGSEAVEMAILTARLASKKNTIISLRHAYHGGTATPLALCGHNTWKFSANRQSDVVHAHAPYCYRCPFGAKPETCSLECAEDIKNVIETTTSGDIAGFIAEPIMGVGGFIDPPLEYFRRAHAIVKQYGGHYISDEVQTGIGRTGKNFFAIVDADIAPDIITMAKGLGSGAPIGAVIAKKSSAEALRGKLHFNTFGGDPYQCMQANEVIDIVADEDLIQNSRVLGDYLKNCLLELKSSFPIIGDVRGRGLMLGLELVSDVAKKTPSPEGAADLLERSKDLGLLIGKGGLYGNVIRIAPPLNISQSECDELISKLKMAFEA